MRFKARSKQRTKQCSRSKKNTVGQFVQLPQQGLTNYSVLSAKDEGLEITVTGLFTRGADGTASLINNPESRSKVSFILSDPKGLLATNDAPKDGDTITILGIITDASTTWEKHLELVAISTSHFF